MLRIALEAESFLAAAQTEDNSTALWVAVIAVTGVLLTVVAQLIIGWNADKTGRINAETSRELARAATKTVSVAESERDISDRATIDTRFANDQVEVWRMREETYVTFRWAANEAMSSETVRVLMGLGVLRALALHTGLVQREDTVFVNEAVKATREACKSVLMSILVEATNTGRQVASGEATPASTGAEGTPSGGGGGRMIRFTATLEQVNAAKVLIEIAKADGTFATLSPTVAQLAAAAPTMELRVSPIGMDGQQLAVRAPGLSVPPPSLSPVTARVGMDRPSPTQTHTERRSQTEARSHGESQHHRPPPPVQAPTQSRGLGR